MRATIGRIPDRHRVYVRAGCAYIIELFHGSSWQSPWRDMVLPWFSWHQPGPAIISRGIVMQESWQCHGTPWRYHGSHDVAWSSTAMPWES